MRHVTFVVGALCMAGTAAMRKNGLNRTKVNETTPRKKPVREVYDDITQKVKDAMNKGKKSYDSDSSSSEDEADKKAAADKQKADEKVAADKKKAEDAKKKAEKAAADKKKAEDDQKKAEPGHCQRKDPENPFHQDAKCERMGKLECQEKKKLIEM